MPGSQPGARPAALTHTALRFPSGSAWDEIRGRWRREANAAHTAPTLVASGIGPLPGVGGSEIAIEMGSHDQAGAGERQRD